jgi:CRP/FNR family transcriptional regulator, nitrogen oxide reductase regulator
VSIPRDPFRSIEEAFRRAPLFGALSEDQRAELVRCSRRVDLAAGEHLWEEGAGATHLGLLVVGRLRIARIGARGEVVVDLAVPGDLLGEVAFSLGASYQSTPVCQRRASVVLVPAQAVRDILERDPQGAIALALDLAAQVVRLYHAAEDVASGTVEERLARVVLRLADRAGEPHRGHTLVSVRLRRSDLAAMAATTLESVSRKISKWRRLGWVEAHPSGYLLCDLSALRAIADAR